jgi:hypothetical protein
MLQALTHFLVKHLEFAQYREEFAEDLAAILENAAADDEAKNLARKLAHRCALDEADAVDQVDGILRRNQKTMDYVLNRARKQKAEQLTAKFARSEPRAIAVVQQQLADAGLSLDALTVKGIQGQSLETIERFDRLIATAEIRRNASLREIDRRRTALSEAVRRTVQKIEHDELKVIETTPIRGKSAA